MQLKGRGIGLSLPDISYVVSATQQVKKHLHSGQLVILENTFRAVNIGLVNEMAIICNKLNINVWEVIDAAATKPI